MENSPLFDALMFSEAHYREIGKVAANWAVLEAMVGSVLWVLAEVKDKPGACLTAQIPNMARRVDALESLLKLRGASKELLKRVHAFGNDTYGLGEQRNRVVHDPWHVDESGTLNRLQITAKGVLQFGYVPVPVSEIVALTKKIAAHIDRFEELCRTINSELGPLPGMQQKASP